MRMIRVRVSDETFDYFTHRAVQENSSLAAIVRDMLEAAPRRKRKPVSDGSDTQPDTPEAESLPPGRVGRPTTDQWARLNKWLAATGRQPEPGAHKTKSGLLAWAVSQGFQP